MIKVSDTVEKVAAVLHGGVLGGRGVWELIYLSVGYKFDNVDVTLQWEWIVSSFDEEVFQSS